MEISIFGLGYVGAVSLACLARDGHQVVGVDIDQTKLNLIKEGKSPIIESGMPELMEEVVATGRVSLTDSVEEACQKSRVSFICVGTPSQPNGSQDQSAVLRLTEQLGDALATKDEHHVIVFRSTLTPGTVEEVLIPILEKRSGKKNGSTYEVCFQPEFLREGSSIKDYDNPPFTIVGAEAEKSKEIIREVFGNLPAELVFTDVATAETMKYFCNIFHALKITFANEVARLCEPMNVDPHKVMELVCMDKQLNISPAYLKPGFSFGGSCLPKDLRAMNYIAKTADVDIPMLRGVLASNRVHLDRAVEKIAEFGQRKIGMIGLSFKSGTDDLRESPLVDLAEKLIGKGYDLKIHDPKVSLSHLIGANKKYIEQSIPHIGSLLVSDLEELVKSCDTIVVGLSDKELTEVVVDNISNSQNILDLVNIQALKETGANYEGVCW